MEFRQESYGKLPDGREARCFLLVNDNGLEAKLTNYGAILISLKTPDRDDKFADITLGYDTLDGWTNDSAYMGATVGRYGNRISGPSFELDGQRYNVTSTGDNICLHGGREGFNRKLWHAEPVARDNALGVAFTCSSADGEEGFPGKLDAAVTYLLTNDNELRIGFAATTDKPTVVNLVHHTYWNLLGNPSRDVLGHVVTIHGEHITVVRPDGVPTGVIAPVAGTPLDFRKAKPIGRDIAKIAPGYDHNYVLGGNAAGCRPVAKVVEPSTGRVMLLHTDQPGMQFYTGNFLGGDIRGKGGIAYNKHAGFCMETQKYPDSPNHPHFPSTVLRPGETYQHLMVHEFDVER
jgi:aldose 1-epimerase